MKLLDRQSKFAHMLAMLILHAETLGYEVTISEVQAVRTNPSLHPYKLAADVNLFLNGEYQRSTKAHEPLGVYWESLGGTWGGRFSSPDGNHYSFGPYKGIR